MFVRFSLALCAMLASGDGHAQSDRSLLVVVEQIDPTLAASSDDASPSKSGINSSDEATAALEEGEACDPGLDVEGDPAKLCTGDRSDVAPQNPEGMLMELFGQKDLVRDNGRVAGSLTDADAVAKNAALGSYAGGGGEAGAVAAMQRTPSAPR